MTQTGILELQGKQSIWVHKSLPRSLEEQALKVSKSSFQFSSLFRVIFPLERMWRTWWTLSQRPRFLKTKQFHWKRQWLQPLGHKTRRVCSEKTEGPAATWSSCTEPGAPTCEARGEMQSRTCGQNSPPDKVRWLGPSPLQAQNLCKKISVSQMSPWERRVCLGGRFLPRPSNLHSARIQLLLRNRF